MLTYLLIFLGSGLGGVARFWLGNVVQKWWGPNFPLGTLLVNISGCFGIGLCAALMTDRPGVREDVRLAILIGIFGGYTTFSSFGRETLQLIRDGYAGRAAINVLLSVVGSLLAVWIGTLAGTRHGANHR